MNMSPFLKPKKKEPQVDLAAIKTKLYLNRKRLEKRERELRNKEEKARLEAKSALKAGDERGFKKASRRFGYIHGQVEAVSSMLDMVESMIDMIEMQEGVKDIVAIGSDLKEYQRVLGLDPVKLENAVTTIRESMERLNQASEMISDTMDTITTTQDTSLFQEELRNELMAEISEEKAAEEELEKKLAAQGA